MEEKKACSSCEVFGGHAYWTNLIRHTCRRVKLEEKITDWTNWHILKHKNRGEKLTKPSVASLRINSLWFVRIVFSPRHYISYSPENSYFCAHFSP